MEEINIKNYTKYSLELIFDEANKFFKDTSESVNRNSNRSFLLLAFYSSVISFSFLRLIDNEYQYITLMIGTIISLLFIKKNIFPTKREVLGIKPDIFLDKYFNQFSDEELEKEQIASLIQSYNNSINIELTESMSKRFEKSLYCFFSTLVLLLVFFLIYFFKCKYASC